MVPLVPRGIARLIRLPGRSWDMTAAGTPASKPARSNNAGGRDRLLQMEKGRVVNDAAFSNWVRRD
jgi:hypothetical protein